MLLGGGLLLKQLKRTPLKTVVIKEIKAGIEGTPPETRRKLGGGAEAEQQRWWSSTVKVFNAPLRPNQKS